MNARSERSANPLAAPRAVGRVVAAGALAAMTVVALVVAQDSARRAGLFAIGCALGLTLHHAAFGFAGAYRRVIVERDMSGVTAQLLMLALAMALFAPVLATGEIFGRGVGGALAPVSVAMALGALLFGVGMQIGGGCASGTLFTAGGGSPRMAIVLVAFCAGCFWATLHLGWWQALPGTGAISLGERLGYTRAVAVQLGALAAVYTALRLAGARNASSLGWEGGFTWRALARGPWPLLLGAALLALLNLATLALAGHPWTITWGFTLWAAKAAVFLGWDPSGSGFWSGGFPAAALARPILADTTSVMNIGIVLGAALASAVSARAPARPALGLRGIATAIVGGLMLGYGARLAYGCNVGAFFSGIASTSVHGWVWIVFAAAGNVAGVRLTGLLERRAPQPT